MLLVFLARIGVAMACEPHEFAELFDGASTPEWVMTADDDGNAADQLTDHCRQCSCHFGVVLPTNAAVAPAEIAASPMVLAVAPHLLAPLDRRLRPPIV